MSQSKSKQSRSQAQRPGPRRKTKWWAYVLLILVLVLAWPAYRYNVSYGRLAGAQNDMVQGDLDAAINKLELEAQTRPQSGEVAYWLAVAHRRAGRIKKFNELIEQAKSLKYSPEEIERQILLSGIQTGVLDGEVERQADELIEKADQYAGPRFDLFLDEFYEARARGYMANYQLVDAEVTLNHWIEARPASIQARMFRALVKEREQNRFQAAESEYREILEMKPDHFEARSQYARLLLFNQQVAEAITQFEECLKIDPSDVRVQLGLAECEYRGGKKLDIARGRLENLLTQTQETEDRGKTLFLLGEIARFQGKHDLVIRYLTEAVELSPNLGAAPYRSLSSSYAILKQRDQAEKYLAIAKRKSDQQARIGHISEKLFRDPTNAELRFEQGVLFNEENNPDQASIWWQMAVRFDSDHLPAHSSLANYYSQKQDSQKADYHRAMAARSAPKMVGRLWKNLTRDELEKVQAGMPWIANYPDLADDRELLTLGLAVAEGKDLYSAVDKLKRLVDNSRLKFPALTLLGQTHRQLGNYAAARRAFALVVATNPQDAAAHWGLQNVCRDIGAFAEMEVHTRKVAELEPDDFRPRRALGELHMRNKKWDLAIPELQASLNIAQDQPDKDGALLELAECLTEAKQISAALTLLKESKASPKKSYVEARCRYESKEIAKAKQLLDIATKPPVEHLPSLLLRADIALSGKELDVAEKMLSRALKLAPQSSQPHRKLAALLRQKGETEAALAEEKSASELEALEKQLADLAAKAARNSDDVESRKELAAVTRKLGRDAEAKHWETVVVGITQKLDQPVLGAKTSAVAPESPNFILAPAEKPRPVELPKIPPVKESNKQTPPTPSQPPARKE